MLFLLESRARPGVTREQVVRQLTQQLSPGTWNMIRNGVVSNVLYKTGTDAGFFAVLHAPSLADADALVRKATEAQEVFDIRIVPVHQFPHFD